MPGDEVICGAAFTEQLRQSLELTGDSLDRIILEVGGDIERMNDILAPGAAGHFLKQAQKAQVIRSRSELLMRLYDLIQERRDRLEKESGATLIAHVIIKLQEVMDELKLSQDIRTALIQNLLTKIEAEEKDKKGRKR